MKTLIITFAFLVFIIAGCTEQTEKPDTEAAAETDTTERTSDAETTDEADQENDKAPSGWAGNYFGTLPCADCEGIETTLSLNKDNTYSVKMVYLGKDVTPFEEKGSISFKDDGKIMVLNGDDGSSTQYLLGDNMVTQLDGDGNVITGDLADSFILKKTY